MTQNPTPALTSPRLAQLREIPARAVSSPGYIIHLDRLEENCSLLASVARQSGAKVLLALKGFACHSTFPIIAEYLSGTTSSGVHEALLAREFFGKEVHVYCPAFKEEDFAVLRPFAHSIVFNSPSQLLMGMNVLESKEGLQFGLRINPEYSEVETALYDPCTPDSRLGTTRSALDEALAQNPNLLQALDGLHFHALCEQDADALDHTVAAFEENFSFLFGSLKWVNFGGGHHITRPGYDVDLLIEIVRDARER
ncbi:MAG: carboxynorspermidine decarboxylase, partial [Opitutales bacterium]